MLLQRIVALLIAIVTFFANCFGITSLNMVPYAELRTELDDSIPLLTGDHSEELLTNIDRGVRMEVYLTLGPGCAIPGTQEDAYDFLDTCIEKYAQEAPREAQVYIYLNEYFDHDLDEAAFTQLREYLEYVRSGGIWAFCFALHTNHRRRANTRLPRSKCCAISRRLKTG